MSSNSIPGLSGYDFTSIIDMMVTSYRQPETSMKTQQTTLKTQQSAWQDIKTRLSALENTLATLKKTETWTSTKATSSNKDLLDAKGGTTGVTGTYTVKINRLAQAQSAVTKVLTAADTKTGIEGLGYGDRSFSINGANIEIKATGAVAKDGDGNEIKDADGNPLRYITLQDIQNGINKGTTAVKASIVQIGNDGSGNGQYRLSLTAASTGTANMPSFADGADGFLNALGFTLDGSGKIIDPDGDPNTPLDSVSGGITVAAADAEIVVNGLTITNSSNTITTAIQGITLNLNDADPAKTIKVAVEQDTSVAQSAVQAFIDKYNSLMTSIADKANYDKASETAGALYADPTLRNIESHLRTLMGSTWGNAGGGYTIFSDLGISTSSDNFGKDATLTFDADKFQKAIANNTQSVANLFGAAYNGVDPEDVAGKTGLANVFEDYIHPMVKFQGTLDKTNDSYTRQLKDLQDRLDDFEERATAYEDMIKLKFSRLETALSALSQQSSSLTSMLNSMKSQTSTK